jgi:hypothetical protein
VPQSVNTLADTQLKVSSNISKVTLPPIDTVLVSVTEGVNVTVGVVEVNPLKLKLIPTPEQKLPEGVGVGVTPIESMIKLTSSHAILGVGVGNGSQSQSK